MDVAGEKDMIKLIPRLDRMYILVRNGIRLMEFSPRHFCLDGKTASSGIRFYIYAILSIGEISLHDIYTDVFRQAVVEYIWEYI